MSIWEEKFNNFKEGKADDSQLIAICQQLIEYIKAHPEEIEGQMKHDEGERTDSMHWVGTESWELDTEINGHSVYWYVEEAMDQDGGEEDPRYELTVDGRTLQDSGYNYSQNSKELEKVAWDLSDEIGKLSGSIAY